MALVIVDTENHQLALRAVENSLKHYKFKDILIFSDDKDKWNGYSTIKIEKIKNIEDYNNLIIKILPEYLQTEMALVIQYDGFVLNADGWSDYFQKFDYIGAPWYDKDGWVVGNGGFSLRSRRLIDSVAESSEFNSAIAEDVFICKNIRKKLQLAGINFAPIEISRKFSFEWPQVKWKTFGFHGIFNLPLIYKTELDFLFQAISTKTLERRWKFLASGVARHAPENMMKIMEIIKARKIPLG